MSDEVHYHRLKNLIRGLIRRTETDDESKQLKWEAVGIDAYELSLARSSLRIASEDEDGSSFPYAFTIVDENGNEVEEIKAWSRNDDYQLKDLFVAASRSHRGVSEKLTEVFNELGIPDPPLQTKDDPWGSAPTSGALNSSDDDPPF